MEICELLGMKRTLKMIEKRSEDEPKNIEEKEMKPHADWRASMPVTELAKIHLARAFIMNPEVLVLEKPLLYFDEFSSKTVMACIVNHVRNRGLGLPPQTR